jgi:AraC-like DNA-binding protein
VAVAPIQKALDYILANLNQRLSIEEIATQVGLSEFHFMRLFKLHTNMTVHQYVTHQRLETAKTMLAHGASSASVAAAVGFYDQSHFTGHFRRAFGLTPKRYAKACR